MLDVIDSQAGSTHADTSNRSVGGGQGGCGPVGRQPHTFSGPPALLMWAQNCSTGTRDWPGPLTVSNTGVSLMVQACIASSSRPRLGEAPKQCAASLTEPPCSRNSPLSVASFTRSAEEERRRGIRLVRAVQRSKYNEQPCTRMWITCRPRPSSPCSLFCRSALAPDLQKPHQTVC